MRRKRQRKISKLDWHTETETDNKTNRDQRDRL